MERKELGFVSRNLAHDFTRPSVENEMERLLFSILSPSLKEDVIHLRPFSLCATAAAAKHKSRSRNPLHFDPLRLMSRH